MQITTSLGLVADTTQYHNANSALFSIWEKRSFFDRPAVVVLGAGIVGLSAALQVKRRLPAQRVLLLERGERPSGASVRNAGFACFGSPSEILADVRDEGWDAAIARVERRWKGLHALREEVGDDALVFKAFGGRELFMDASLYTQVADGLNATNANLKDIFGHAPYALGPAPASLGFGNGYGTVVIADEGAVDTGSMMRHLWEKARAIGIELRPGTTVTGITEDADHARILLQGGGELHGSQVLVATNGYTNALLPALGIRPARGQVLLTSPVEDLPWKGTFHVNEGFYYFRELDGRVLLGGGRNLDVDGETTTADGNTALIMNALETFLRETILPNSPHIVIEHTWSGIMGFGPSKEPTVARVSPSVVAAVGLGGMGVAIGTLVGREAAELVLKEIEAGE